MLRQEGEERCVEPEQQRLGTQKIQREFESADFIPSDKERKKEREREERERERERKKEKEGNQSVS